VSDNNVTPSRKPCSVRAARFQFRRDPVGSAGRRVPAAGRPVSQQQVQDHRRIVQQPEVHQLGHTQLQVRQTLAAQVFRR